MRRSLIDRRGTASVEIAIMLPVFIALLAAVSYFVGAAFAAQSAGMAARSCAWSHALSACEGELPKICQEVGLGKPEELKIARPDGESELTSNGEMDFHESWFDAVARVPVLGGALRSVFGVGKRIDAARSSRAFMSDDSETVVKSNYVLCNTKAETWSHKMSEMFGKLGACDEKEDPLCKP